MINERDVVGQKVISLARTDYRLSETESIPGLTSGTWSACDYFLRLGNGKLVRIGAFRDSDPLRIVDAPDRLTDVELSSVTQLCVGETIAEVLVCEISEQIYFYLSSGRYLWIEFEEGTVLHLESESYFTEDGADSALKMKTYWGDVATEHGGRRFLEERNVG